MFRFKSLAALAGVAALALATTSQAAVVFGNFEGNQADGFGYLTSSTGVAAYGSAGDASGATIAYTTTGATLGTTALSVTKAGFGGNVVAYDFAANGQTANFLANDTVSFDVTYPAGTGADGYRQIYSIALNGPGAGYQQTSTYSTTTNQYPPFTAVTQTVSLNYAAFKAALTGNGYLQFGVSTNNGGSAPTTMYFDNFRLTNSTAVPEPAALGAAGLALTGLATRRRASRR